MIKKELLKDFWRKFNKKKTNSVALIILTIIIFAALFAPYIAPYGPMEMNYNYVLGSPNSDHIFGTDSMGRDIFSRIIYGSRISLNVGLISMSISSGIGLILGLIAGYYSGLIGAVIMRLMDMMLSLPGFLLAMAIIAVLGPDLRNVMIAIGIASIPTFTRVVRAVTLSVKENEYVQSARALGASDFRIILHHIIPNILAPVIVLATLRVAVAIIMAAGLSFIGLGAQPPTPEWGAILNDARQYIRDAWWFPLFPGLSITITVLTINIIGDALRDILDPKTL
ncbi:MAG: ABC transporter permease [Halanaerobiales bacterium]